MLLRSIEFSWLILGVTVNYDPRLVAISRVAGEPTRKDRRASAHPIQLRRPAALFPEWRLDRLLKKKAEQGVRVYVMVYKEVSEVRKRVPSSRLSGHCIHGALVEAY